MAKRYTHKIGENMEGTMVKEGRKSIGQLTMMEATVN